MAEASPEPGVLTRNRRGCLIGGASFVIALALFVLWVLDQLDREMARVSCLNNLHEVGTALLLYEHSHRAYPPAYLTDDTGTPTNSWRLRICPGVLWYDFPKEYDFAKPWDGPDNSKIIPPDLGKACFWCTARRAMLIQRSPTTSRLSGRTQCGRGLWVLSGPPMAPTTRRSW